MAKPPTNWYYRMPWHVERPALSGEGFPIDHVVLLDEGVSRTVSIDLLDTADERLLRSGVRLTCRVQDGVSDWFVWASGWQPWLPGDRRTSMSSDAEMPDEVADMVRPFTGGATLSPVARVTRVRGRYGLLDGDGRTVAVLNDDRLTVRRKGENAGRARELTIDVSGLGATERSHVVRQIEAVGAERVEALVDLFARLELAAPLPAAASGPGPHTTSAQFVSGTLTGRVHDLVLAALTVRGATVSDATPLVEVLARTRAEILALSGVLDPGWCDDQLALIGRLADVSAAEVHFRGDFQDLLDHLDAAGLQPPLVVEGDLPAAELFHGRVEDSVSQFDAAVDRALSEQGDASAWAAALDAARFALLSSEVARPLLSRGARTLRVLGKLVALLAAAQPETRTPTPDRLARLSPQEAFALGQAVDRGFEASREAREHFREQWPHRSGQLAKALSAHGSGRR